MPEAVDMVCLASTSTPQYKTQQHCGGGGLFGFYHKVAEDPSFRPFQTPYGAPNAVAHLDPAANCWNQTVSSKTAFVTGRCRS